jgi:hypothetical protein
MHINTERSHADSHAYSSLSPDEFSLWESCRSAHRFLAFQNKELVVYSLLFDEPQILSTLKCKSVAVSFDKGFSTLWEDSRGTSHLVSHAPVMVYNTIFLWHVFDSQVQYMPYNGKFSATIPLAYRSKQNPSTKQEGVVYILERSVYDSTFKK